MQWGGVDMPYRLIEDTAFDPETIRLLIEAYDAAVDRVGRNQPLLVLETIAKQIIEIAGTGERDPSKIVEYVTRGIGFSSAG
jgi:hypothetical protein